MIQLKQKHRVFFLVSLFLLSVSTLSYASQIEEKKIEATKNLTTIVSPKTVCMVNNKHMGIDQIPVQVGDKTYYGCCQNCVTKLNADEASRYANDPLTQQKVNKADAFTVALTDGSHQVLYFQSEKNYQDYLKTLK